MPENTGELGQAFVTSNRSRARTKTEKGESEKLAVCSEKSKIFFFLRKIQVSKLVILRILDNFARLLSIQVVTVLWISSLILWRCPPRLVWTVRMRPRSLVPIYSKRSAPGARRPTCHRALPSFAVADAAN